MLCLIYVNQKRYVSLIIIHGAKYYLLVYLFGNNHIYTMKYFLAAFVCLLFTQCTTSKMALQDGNYDQAVHLAAKKLMHHSQNIHEIEIIVTAFEKAQQADLKLIQDLKATGDPKNYEKIFDVYKQIESRQNKVKALPTLIADSDTVAFVMIDASAGLEKSREKAAAFFYAQAQQLLATNNKEDARKAYYQLMKLKQFYKGFKDVDALIGIAQQKGMTQVCITVNNKTQFPLPASIKATILPDDVTALNSTWISYTTQKQDLTCDYNIHIDLISLDMSPELINNVTYTDEKQITSTEQHTDAEGLAIKDSLGNMLTTTKTKIILCQVNQTIQQQKAETVALVNYVQQNQLIKTVDAAGGFVWENSYALAYGDLQAASQKTILLLNNYYKPFLPEDAMWYECALQLKQHVWQILLNNKYVIK